MPHARGRKRTETCPACGLTRKACPADSDYECFVRLHLDGAGAVYQFHGPRVTYLAPKVYIPDFTLESGRILEAKGWFPPSDRQKMEAVIRSNPDLDVRLVLQRPADKIRKGSKTTVAQWCDRKGIKWTKGPKVPGGWLK